MENAIQGQEQQLESFKQKSRSLEEMTWVQVELLAERKLKNRELDQLKEMGFGLWELKLLRTVVTEIALESGQATQNGLATKKFISDIESHYPDYLRLQQWNYELMQKINRQQYQVDMGIELSVHLRGGLKGLIPLKVY